MLDELHGWRVAFDAYGRGGLRPTNRNMIARVRGASQNAAMSGDSKGRLISREVFAPHQVGRRAMSGIVARIFLIIALFLYFVPAIIAVDRKVLNSGSIFIVNLA